MNPFFQLVYWMSSIDSAGPYEPNPSGRWAPNLLVQICTQRDRTAHLGISGDWRCKRLEIIKSFLFNTQRLLQASNDAQEASCHLNRRER